MSNPAPPSGAGEQPGGFLVTLAHRPRLLAAALLVVATYLALLFAPVAMRESTRLVVAWNAGAWAYLAMIAIMMARPSADPQIDARPEDENQWVLLLLGVVAACADEAIATKIYDIGWPDSPHRVLRNDLIAAWEEAGRPERARAEYQLVLKLCPESEASLRVTARLAALGGATANGLAARPPPGRWANTVW